MENFHYEKRFVYIIEQINEWIKLSELFGINKLKDGFEDPDFPIELASITKIWEQTWKLPSLLIKISYKYNREIDTVVKWIQTAIEPIVIIVVWAIIGTMIMAILLPFFNMVNVM
jgi:type IV pilus assembly protein PilC